MKNQYFKKSFFVLSIAILFAGLVPSTQVKAQLVVTRDIVFPVIGQVSYINDFGFPRAGGARWHKGNDIFGKKMQPLVAVVDGVIKRVPYPEASWGYGVSIVDSEGYEYWYIHMNNDSPGTDDGLADGRFAYAQDIQPGHRVKRGQLIGYMGDSGNAETTPAHLHFEIEAPGGAGPMNPFPSLQLAERLKAPLADYPELESEILPYEAFAGGASVAMGNLDSDTDFELVTGAQAGGGPLVRVFKQDKLSLASFYAYDLNFRGGVNVAVGDTDGDGMGEIVVAPGPGGGPHIKIFSGSGTLLKEFFAFQADFRGGVNVAVGDTDGDGMGEIVVAPGPGGGPHIKIFSGSGTLLNEYFAYEEKFRGGVEVEVMEKSAVHPSFIVTAPVSLGGSHIKYFDGPTLAQVREFFAYEEQFHGGVRLATGGLTQDATSNYVWVVPASAGGPHLKVFGWDGKLAKEVIAGFEPWWRGGYDVATEAGKVYMSSGPGRRASLREVEFVTDLRVSGRERQVDYSGTTTDKPLVQ